MSTWIRHAAWRRRPAAACCVSCAALLRERFGDGPVVVARITPEQVRGFFDRMSERRHALESLSSLVAALRGYFRFRATTGDCSAGGKLESKSRSELELEPDCD